MRDDRSSGREIFKKDRSLTSYRAGQRGSGCSPSTGPADHKVETTSRNALRCCASICEVQAKEDSLSTRFEVQPLDKARNRNLALRRDLREVQARKGTPLQPH